MSLDFDEGELQRLMIAQVREHVEGQVRGLVCPIHQESPEIVWEGEGGSESPKWTFKACCETLGNCVRREFGMAEVDVDLPHVQSVANGQVARGKMPFRANVFQILIASPSDVPDERQLVREIIYEWNAMHAATLKTVLLPVMWETHATPEMGDRPQGIINRQLVANCDALIGIFWTRLGTHTGSAQSGTAEEIEQFNESGRHVMLYFSSKPVVPDNLDTQQLERLKRFREDCKKKGLIDRYGSLGELREKVARHLNDLVRKFPIVESEPAAIPPSDAAGVAMLAAELSGATERSAVLWRTERDSSPMSVDDGKNYLNSLGQTLVKYRVSLVGKVEATILDRIEEVIREAKEMQRYQVYLDGGASFNKFWKKGDDLYSNLKAIIAQIPQAASN